jgi:DNA-binding MarR family transcriptional regulator
MKVASRLEAKGLMTRGEGRDRRTKGLYLTAEGEHFFCDAITQHDQAEATLAAI